MCVYSMHSLFPRLHSPAFYCTVFIHSAIKSWGVESGNEATVCMCVCVCMYMYVCACAFVCKSHELITVEIMMTPSEVSDRTPAEGIRIIRVSLLGEVLRWEV